MRIVHALALAFAVAGGGLNLRLSAADLTGDYAWKPMKIGGGGWVVGLNISPTEKNLIYARTDVSGAYRWDAAASSWRQVVTASSMPADTVGYGKYAGVDSIVSAPANPDIAYMAFAGQPYGLTTGQIFRSTDRGEHWIPTAFKNTKVRMEPNGEGRQEGERLAVDPRNSDVVYFASIMDGLWVTEDAGATWTRVAGVPAGSAPYGITTVVFDPGAGTTKSNSGGEKTNVIDVTVEQAGIFQTMDAGATWTKISDHGPGDAGKPRDATLGPERTYFVVSDNDKGAVGSVWKRTVAGAWTDITPPPPNGGSNSYLAVAVDPTDARHVVVMIGGGKVWVSSDQGATWTYHLFQLTSPDIQWLGRQQNYYLSTGELAFDPFDPGKFWFAEGLGVWWTHDLTPAQIDWHAASQGIEETCGNDVIAPPGGRPVAAMWDVGAFYFSDPDTYTSERSQPNFMSAWALDWCPQDPKFLVGVFRNHLGFPPHPNSSGYSPDGGRTWTRFPAVENGTTPKDLEYGVIAVSANSTDHIVWAPAQGKLPYYTTDRGATWQPSSFNGATATGFTSYPMSQKPLCADRVLADTFYLYIPPTGLFRSTDGGAHFAKVGNPATNKYNGILKSTPGHGQDLWFADGLGGGLRHSTDGGATWSPIPGLQIAYNVGLGKAQTEGGYPTLYVAGVSDQGETGLFRSTDHGAKWDKICAYPLGIFDSIDAMDGDKDVFGEVYVCFAGSGFAYGKLAPSPAK
jgi:photosystem II stability/assembly factor-like uncharacterized protein